MFFWKKIYDLGINLKLKESLIDFEAKMLKKHFFFVNVRNLILALEDDTFLEFFQNEPQLGS